MRRYAAKAARIAFTFVMMNYAAVAPTTGPKLALSGAWPATPHSGAV